MSMNLKQMQARLDTLQQRIAERQDEQEARVGVTLLCDQETGAYLVRCDPPGVPCPWYDTLAAEGYFGVWHNDRAETRERIRARQLERYGRLSPLDTTEDV